MEWIKIADKLPPVGKGVLILLVTKLQGIEEPVYWATFGRLTLEKGLCVPETDAGYIREEETLLAWAAIPLPDQPKRLNEKTPAGDAKV